MRATSDGVRAGVVPCSSLPFASLTLAPNCGQKKGGAPKCTA